MADSYRTFAQSMLASVERIADSFTMPDDDWVPALIIDSRVLGPMPIGFVMTPDKDAVVAALAQLLRETRTERCVLVLSAWQAEVGPGWDGRPAAELSNRREVVAVTVIDAERVESYSAPILRFADAPPRLGEWTMTACTDGRFVTPLQRAMR
jgi:hypothetical protein